MQYNRSALPKTRSNCKTWLIQANAWALSGSCPEMFVGSLPHLHSFAVNEPDLLYQL